MEFLVIAFVVLTAITIIGHGIWLAVARIVGGPPRENLPRRCPRCGLALLGDHCKVCYWPSDPRHAQPNPREALEQISAQIARLGQLEILGPLVRGELEAAIEAERNRRVAPPSVRVPTAPPAAEPVIVATAVPPAAGFPAEAAPFERQAVVPVLTSPERSGVQQAAAPAPPRATWSDWLASFMEERNIRWGELVAGLLIVCSSIALVISFWSAIEARPWLKFLLFNGATACTFGAGFYCEHRLRLRTTAQGLLTIGSLLVPLNFLAIAALSSAPEAGNLAMIGAEVLSAAFFATLIYFAARVLVGADIGFFTAGVMLPALANLLVRRFIHPGAALPTLAWVAAAPTAAYLAANLWHLRRLEHAAKPREADANSILKFLGITSFAVVLPLTLLAYKTGQPLAALRQLPLVAAVVGSCRSRRG